MEWGEVFGDQVVATAILDRLLHHSHVLTIRGDSYRLREKRRSGLIPPAGGRSLLTGQRWPKATAVQWGGLRKNTNPMARMLQADNNNKDTTPADETPIQGPPEDPHQQAIRWTNFRVASGGPIADVA